MTKEVEIVYGAAFWAFDSEEENFKQMKYLEQAGVKRIDTAYIYTNSEERLGRYPGRDKFVIDTKAPGFVPGCTQKDKLIAAGDESLKRLSADSVNIYYLHSPDEGTPIEETLEGIQEMYEQGKFKYFGLSNFLPKDVENVHAHQSQKGWVLPTVYQGLYNPVARHAETELFPILRKLNISFYVYSALAAGLLTKSREQIESASAGQRWDKSTPLGNMLNKNWNTPHMLDALTTWNNISEKSGIPKAELAYRWVRYHSALKGDKGDAIIFGASSLKQLEQTVTGLNKGPLEVEVIKQIEGIWGTVKQDSPLNNYYAKGGVGHKGDKSA